MAFQLESQTVHFSMALSLVIPQDGKCRNHLHEKKPNTLPVFPKWIQPILSPCLPSQCPQSNFRGNAVGLGSDADNNILWPPSSPLGILGWYSSILPITMHYAHLPLEINTLLCKSCSLVPIASLASKSFCWKWKQDLKERYFVLCEVSCLFWFLLAK